MQVYVKGRQIDVGDALREHVEASIKETSEKFLNNAIDATVVFSKEANHLFKADIVINMGSGIMLQANHKSEDPYPAFDHAAARVTKRMRRYKGKLKDHHKKMNEVEIAQLKAMSYTIKEEDFEEEPVANEPAIIAEMATTIQKMSPSDAVMRMDLAELPALMFKNSKHGGLNMVYRRSDGNIGWVDPQDS